MPPGDSRAQCPQPGSTIQVTRQGVAVFSAATALYASYLDSSLPDVRTVLGVEVGSALLDLLDACHDLVEP